MLFNPGEKSIKIPCVWKVKENFPNFEFFQMEKKEAADAVFDSINDKHVEWWFESTFRRMNEW